MTGSLKIITKKSCKSFFLEIVTLSVLIQFFSTRMYAQEVVIKSISTNNNGNSEVLKKVMFFDQDGFLWYNTFNGFVKYTGSEDIFYSMKNAEFAIKDVYQANDIYLSSKNIMWIATEEGLFWMDFKTGKTNWYTQFVPEIGNNLDFMSIKEDSRGNMLFSTQSNIIYTYSNSNQFIQSLINDNKEVWQYYEPFYNTGFTLDEELPDTTWVVHDNQRVYTIKPEYDSELVCLEGDLIWYFNPNSSMLMTDNGEVFPENQSGYFTIGNEQGFFEYIPKIKKQLIQVPFNQSDLYMTMEGSSQSGNKLLVGVNLNVLNFYSVIFKDGAYELKILKEVPFASRIRDCVKDKYNNLWINAGEIYTISLKENLFEKFLAKENSENSEDVSISCRGLIEDSEGNIIIYTYNGLFLLKKGGSRFERLELRNEVTNQTLPLVEVYNIKKQNDSIVWGFGYSNRIFKMDVKNKKYASIDIPKEVLQTQMFISDALITENNKMLLSGSFGLLEFDLNSERFAPSKIILAGQEATDRTVYVLYAARNKDIWIGMGNHSGLYRWDHETGIVDHFTNGSDSPIKLMDNNIRCIIEDDDGFLWVGTEKGIQKINLQTQETKTYGVQEGIHNTNITGLLDDGMNIWFGTFNGLGKLNKDTGIIIDYYEKDGLTHNEFNIRSTHKSEDGLFYFGGLNGLVRFNPKDFQSVPQNNQIFLTSYELYAKDSRRNEVYSLNLNDLTEFEIPYYHNYISLNFAINNLADSGTNSFQYKIVEINDTWINLSHYNKIQLSGLSPGGYTLLVKGISGKGQGTNVLKYNIHIRQIFYKQWWFLSIVLGVACLLVYLWTNRERRLLKFKLAQKAQIALLEARALRSLMNPHFIFNAVNSMQSVLFLKTEEEANKFFSSFARLLRITVDMSNLDSILLEDELNYLESYIKFEGMRFDGGIKVVFNIEEDLPSDQIRIPSMLFQPLVENAILHGLSKKEKDRKIEIAIKKVQNLDILHATVQDNGIGRVKATVLSNRKKEHVSKATLIMNDRINVFNKLNSNKMSMAILDLSDKKGQPTGTRVVLTIPFKWNKGITGQQLTG